jgi:hypothetical protein
MLLMALAVRVVAAAVVRPMLLELLELQTRAAAAAVAAIAPLPPTAALAVLALSFCLCPLRSTQAPQPAPRLCLLGP